MSTASHILGIDPASYHVGWCLLEDGKYSNSGVISPPKKADLLSRRDFIRDAIRELFVALSGLPDLVIAVEDGMSMGIGTAKVLATIRTMMEEMAVSHGWAFIQISPSDWHGVCYSEDAKRIDENIKDLALRLAKVHSDGAIELQDAADAYFIARFCYEKARWV